MSIKTFFIKLISYSLLVFIINLGIGMIFKNDNAKKTKLGIFYPELRWNEFYSLEKKSIDIAFIGSSLCYRGFNPELIDSVTHKKSFNLGSSIQSITTTYFVLSELLKYQKPKTIYLDLTPRAFNLQGQLESVRYNYEFMHSGESKTELYFDGLNFSEKIKFLFPTYYKRDQLNSILKYAFKPIDTSKIKDYYYKKGFVKSTKRMSQKELENKAQDLQKFNWVESERTDSHLLYFQKIIDLCKKNEIELVLTSAPWPKAFYSKLNLLKFELLIQKISKANTINYLNFNKIDLPLVDTLHFKDHHLNHYGSRVFSHKIAEIIKSQP